ncbi:ABC transporter permease subunit [Ectobacillus sp. JY-23]|uniref:ABC transporter permease n=1 Tax=Ectobacillus sp. JY-23 TaxID=2933872 RepID=UPI001FF4C10E|nr:ABC transporter permease [Ectobacillus sp. JY-23]UOY91634.1 ABC transporter permease subunit [Ectobacillus sp. JY-23]
MTWHVYVKEMIDALRDRKTLILSVLIPVLFNIGLVLFMDRVFLAEKKETYTLAVKENTSLQVLDWIKELEDVEIEIAKDPTEVVKAGDAQAALEVDSSFEEKFKSGQSPGVTVYADSSSQKGSAAADKIMTQLTVKQQIAIQERLAASGTDPNVIKPFQLSLESISEQDDMSLYMITIFSQLILILGILTGQLSVANDLFAGEKERKTMEALIMTPVNRLHIILGKWLAISSLGMIGGIFSLITFVTVVTFFTDKLAKALNIGENLFFFISSLGIGIITFALLTATVLMILSLLANTMKEAQNYTAPLMTVVMIPYFMLIGLSPNELGAKHFLIPFMNIFALIKQLIYGIYVPINILYVALSSLTLMAICFSIAYMMFKKSKWVLGKS